jgi:hypothetical protein
MRMLIVGFLFLGTTAMAQFPGPQKVLTCTGSHDDHEHTVTILRQNGYVGKVTENGEQVFSGPVRDFHKEESWGYASMDSAAFFISIPHRQSHDIALPWVRGTVTLTEHGDKFGVLCNSRP